MRPQIELVWRENFEVYGARKARRQLEREEVEVARCTIERLMRQVGLQGVVRGRKTVTTVPDRSSARPPDLVDRRFRASRPNELWVAVFAYVATWSGCVYVDFVVDVFARRIAGWRASASMRTDLVLDALEQALGARPRSEKLVHQSDRRSQLGAIGHVPPAEFEERYHRDQQSLAMVVGLNSSGFRHSRGGAAVWLCRNAANTAHPRSHSGRRAARQARR